MALTASELIETLQQEVRILLHLAGKVEPSMLDDRSAKAFALHRYGNCLKASRATSLWKSL